MRGIFWNSRGLKDLAKRRFLAEASLEHHLDFIAFPRLDEVFFLHNFLAPYLGGLILTGTASHLEEDPVGFYLGLSLKCWRFGV